MKFFLKLAKSSPKVRGEERELSRGMQTSGQRETCHDFACLVPNQARKTGNVLLFLPNSEIRIQILITILIFHWGCAEVKLWHVTLVTWPADTCTGKAP